MKRHIIAVLTVALLSGTARSEVRTWTGSSGSQLKAELIKETGGKVILRDETGRELKVQRSYLSRADIAYLDDQIVPVIGINPKIKVTSVFKTGVGVVQVVEHEIEVRQISSAVYSQPILVTLSLVGSVGGKNYVVLQRTQEQVTFTAHNRKSHISGPDLSLGSPELQKKYDIKYIGYLIVATTHSGRVINVESDSDLLKSNAGFITEFKAGDLFDADMKLLD